MPNRRRVWLWPAATAAGILALATAIFVAVNGPGGLLATTIVPADVPRGATSTGEPSLGFPHAPVVIEEFGDFQCPFCGQFVRETEPRLISAYVESGKVRIVWHTLAFLGPESVLAGRAAWCAQQQGKFWEYFALLYQHQGGENIGTFSATRLERWAVDLRLDRAAFDTCLSSERSLAGLHAGVAEAQRLDVNVTPTFVINGQKVSGALPFQQLSQLIDAALAAAR